MKLYLIRHSKTFGNTKGRYIGVTDEPLCQAGIKLLEGKYYPRIQMLYTSPLKRCTETAALLYPDKEIHIIEELAECNFGAFENKSYEELKTDPRYQAWIDSGGSMAFPEGESQEQFRNRCVHGFERVVLDTLTCNVDSAALVVHGGTIMAILDRYSSPHEDFYFWQVKNGEGYEIELDSVQWKKGKREVTVCGSIPIGTAGGKKQL